MIKRDDLPDHYASVPFRCVSCRSNSWHVFTGDADRERADVVLVRLRCANPKCKHVVVRRWFIREAA